MADDDDEKKLHGLHAERRGAAQDYTQALNSLLAQLFHTDGPDLARIRNDVQVVLGNAEFLRATAKSDPEGNDVFAPMPKLTPLELALTKKYLN